MQTKWIKIVQVSNSTHQVSDERLIRLEVQREVISRRMESQGFWLLSTFPIPSQGLPLQVMPCFKEPMEWHEQHHRIHHLFWKILKSIWHVHQFSSTLCIHYACLCDRPRRPPFEQLVREPSKWNQPERGKAGETCNLRRFAIFLSLTVRGGKKNMEG